MRYELLDDGLKGDEVLVAHQTPKLGAKIVEMLETCV